MVGRTEAAPGGLTIPIFGHANAGFRPAGQRGKAPTFSVKKTVVIVLLVGVLGYVGLMFFLGSVVKTGVNGFGPKFTKTKVELGSATLSPLTGSGTLGNLVVATPQAGRTTTPSRSERCM